jgi:alpha-galactosidase
MHNRLWANDPDCLLVRTDRTKMTLDEVRTLAGVIGLSGGMVLSSDDLERVPPERAELISMLLPPLPVAATPVDLMERDMPERFEVHIDRDFDPLHVVGLFNFQDVTHDLVLPLPEGRWHVFELWEERYLGARDGAVTFTLVAPHASRIVSLRRVRGEPCVVGSTAHVGMGAVDMTAQTWDAATSTLRIDVSPTGRAARRLWVATTGLRLRGVEADGASLPFNLLEGAADVRLDVHRATSLRFRFSSN